MQEELEYVCDKIWVAAPVATAVQMEEPKARLLRAGTFSGATASPHNERRRSVTAAGVDGAAGGGADQG